MSFDPDNVRIDLLRVKRKIFLNYPEGSKERHDFLVSSKLAELGYLTKLVPEESANLVWEEHNKLVFIETTHIAFSLFVGFIFSLFLLTSFHIHYYLWLVPGVIGLFISSLHGLHLYEEFKKMEPFKRELATIQSRIDRLKKELKDLG